MYLGSVEGQVRKICYEEEVVRDAWKSCTGTSLIPWAGAAAPKLSLHAIPHWNPNVPFISAAPQLY